MRHFLGLLAGLRDRGVPTAPAARLAPAAASMVAVWAVRWDWPDGVHEFIGPAVDLPAAAGLLSRQVKKWRRFPYRPDQSMVQLSLSDFWLHARHRPDCKAPDCPVVDVVVSA
ncbi:hypothetical protein [Paractinoplanes toevensis]|uniref:Uncharacterized protein n=1 Tax=Paractinoplanes toevensis TaxID=571911 RepID=A0A919TFI2_9ACTN|nr:hypothetical protein [Actinoplanes toevensis]GIM94402.1 hypothetical protein Ato02nite_061950 [Actinoplanes toevensis]